MRIDERSLDLLDSCGQAIPATVFLDEGDHAENEFPPNSVSLTLRWAGGEATATDSDYFSVLCTVREELARHGLMPRCFGSCRNLVLSGMCVDMGQGLKGYLVKLGQKARMQDLVSIFEAGSEMDLVSVMEQRAFNDEWLKFLGIKLQ